MSYLYCNIDDVVNSILTYMAVKFLGANPDDDDCYLEIYSDIYLSKDCSEAFIQFDEHDLISKVQVEELLSGTPIKIFESDQFGLYGIKVSMDMMDKLPKELLQYM